MTEFQNSAVDIVALQDTRCTPATEGRLWTVYAVAHKLRPPFGLRDMKPSGATTLVRRQDTTGSPSWSGLGWASWPPTTGRQRAAAPNCSTSNGAATPFALSTPTGPQHDVKLLQRAEVPWYFSRGHEFDSHCGRSLFRLWFLDFGCPACGEGLRATFGHEPVNPGPFGTGVVCALAVP